MCKLATINTPKFPLHWVYTHMLAPPSSRETVSKPTAVRLQGETLRNLPADCSRPAPTGYSRTLTKIWHHFSTVHVSTWPSQLKVPGSTSSFPPHDIMDKEVLYHTQTKRNLNAQLNQSCVLPLSSHIRWNGFLIMVKNLCYLYKKCLQF